VAQTQKCPKTNADVGNTECSHFDLVPRAKEQKGIDRRGQSGKPQFHRAAWTVIVQNIPQGKKCGEVRRGKKKRGQ